MSEQTAQMKVRARPEDRIVLHEVIQMTEDKHFPGQKILHIFILRKDVTNDVSTVRPTTEISAKLVVRIPLAPYYPVNFVSLS